jgi:spore germination cell wall hydrolase CwlJ-like protein
MRLFRRPANFAALTFIGAILTLSTSPGFATELGNDTNRPAIVSTLVNAVAPGIVPAADAPLPPSVQEIAPQPAMIQTIPENAVVQDTIVEDAIVEDEANFPTLAAAVAAQDTAALDRELNCIAVGVYFEAKGEPLAGQLAVAHTIINRTRSGRFPASACSVLTQRGQFSFVRRGVVPDASGRAGWRTAVAVAKVAASELWDSAAPKALFFHARHVSPRWRMTRVAAVGNHIFYR